MSDRLRVSARHDVVTFLSDFGTRDTFVGQCHAIIVARAPHVHVVDLTHRVPPQDVRSGALLLARAVVNLPVAIHLAVVDPGVGSTRRPIAVRAGRGDGLVGPDNGLLLAAAEALGGVTAAHELAAPRHRRDTVSRTFHGRDVFAPAAAALACGVDAAELGPRVDDLVTLTLPRTEVHDGVVATEVALVDTFGNVQLDATPDDLARIGDPAAVEAVSAGRSWTLAVVRTFADLERGDLGLYADADGRLALTVNQGSAQKVTGLATGAPIELTGRPSA